MNSIIYKQTDSRWGKKAYPSGSTVGGCGCGLLACTHVAMEQESKKNWTPDNLRSYMVNKGFAIRGQGTRWEGITETLMYIGHKNVLRIYNDPMSEAWKELNKGNRIGVLLFNSHVAPNGVKWTASGHYVAFTGYKYESNKHYFYTKDSGGRNHSGWYSYENSMRGCISKLWIVERVGKQATAATTTKATSAVTSDGKLVVDGVGGKATVLKLQKFLGVKETGGITIKKDLHKYCPSLKAVEYGTSGSGTVKYMQKWLGISADGHWGAGTSKALQKKLGVSQDGIFGKQSMQALQKYLNSNTKAVYPPTPTKTIIDKELEACKVQADWMKNSKYEYESKPTIEKSKKKGTCVTYVACVLQRIGVLKSGQNLWHNESGKVYGNNDKMTVTYPKGKTLHQLKSQLKAGDIVMDGSGVGSNSHIFILTGKWSGDNPIIWDNHSGQQSKGAYTYTRNRKVIAYVRLK